MGNFVIELLGLFTGSDIVEVQNEMRCDAENHHHQQDDSPIKGMLYQVIINDLHNRFLKNQP